MLNALTRRVGHQWPKKGGIYVGQDIALDLNFHRKERLNATVWAIGGFLCNTLTKNFKIFAENTIRPSARLKICGISGKKGGPVRILKPGKKIPGFEDDFIYTVTCPICDCEFEFVLREATWNRLLGKYFVICPNTDCKKLIYEEWW